MHDLIELQPFEAYLPGFPGFSVGPWAKLLAEPHEAAAKGFADDAARVAEVCLDEEEYAAILQAASDREMQRATIARSFCKIFSIRLGLWLGFPHRMKFAGLHRENIDGVEIDRILVTLPRSTFERIQDDVVARQHLVRPVVQSAATEPDFNPWVALFEVEESTMQAVDAERLPKLLTMLPLAFRRYRELPVLPRP